MCAQAFVATFALAVMVANAAFAAVSLRAGSATAPAPGETAEICVSLDTGGAEVAGTQNDLTWDGNCATLADRQSCSVAGSHGKQLTGAITCGDFCFRAIILSLTNVDPIPDGPLYCCTFTVETDPGSCCDIAVVNSATSDPEGQALQTVSMGGRLCVAGGLPEPPTATPTVTPRAGSSSSDDDGCQVGPATNGLRGPLLLALVLGLVRCLVRKPANAHQRGD